MEDMRDDGNHVIGDLSEYVDGELEPSRRAAVESHLASCATCGAVAADLQSLVRAAGSLEDQPPAADLWPAVARRIAPTPEARVVPLPARPARRVSLSWTQLAAAAIALVVLAGGSMWLALSPEGALPGAAPGGTADRGRIQGTGEAILAGLGQGPYDSAVADLEEALEASRDRLDPGTVAAIERNLRIIDDAIADTRRALAADPNSIYLSAHLAEQMRRQLDVLRTASEMAANASI